MAYKEITSLDADVTVAIGGKNRKTNKTNPTQVEGFYLGTRQVQSPKSKTGLASIHYFQTSKGNVGVWGKTDMDRKMSTATPGAMTLVKFEKMQPTPNGEMYKYSVAQDEDNTIEVSVAPTQTSSNDSDESSEEENNEESYETQSEENDEDEAQAAALLAAERKAKVQSLLNKGKQASKK